MPFEREKLTGRTNEKLGWSLGIVYPESVIFGDYNLLPYYVLTIAIVGLLLMFLIYRYVIHRQLLPLQMLSEKAQRIAEGNYNETIPKAWHRDEIGRLQLSFQQMQQSLANYIGELEGLKTTLNQRGEKLQAAYKEAHKADRLKMAFMHNMTNQMLAPSEALTKDAKALCDKPTDPKEIIRLTDDIQQKGNAIAELVENLINRSDEEIRKEADDV
jgi:methyl-accepting chemotaxis protein